MTLQDSAMVILQWVVGLAGGGGILFLVARYAGARMADLFLERRMAEFRSRLDREAERLRYELQREMLKATLTTNKTHVVYPRLYEKLRRAEGAVGGLWGGRFARSFEGYLEADFEEYMKHYELPAGLRWKLHGSISADREHGIVELEGTIREAELGLARRSLANVMNYVVLKSLYLSSEVKGYALKVHEHLVTALSAVSVIRKGAPEEKWSDQAESGLKAAGEQLKLLEARMRAELEPSSDRPGSSAKG